MTRKIGLMCCVVALGCGGTRTGNPDTEPPSYQSPSRFIEEPTGVQTGGDLGGPCWSVGQPPYRQAGGDFARLRGDTLVVVAEQRGLLVVDVSDPTAPRLRGALAIDGRPLQLEVDADGAGATLVVVERTVIDADDIPEQPLAEWTTRLMRVDLGDPTQPRRAFDTIVTDSFWQMEVRGERVFLLEQILAPTEAVCTSGGGLATTDEFACPMATAMRVTSYDMGTDEFTERESVELPAKWNQAFVVGDTFFVVEGHTDPEASAPRILHWFDFGSGALAQGGPFTLPALLRTIARDGDTIALLSEDVLDASVSLHLATLDDAGEATLRGSVAAPPNATHVTFAGDIAIVDGGSAQLVDVSDPNAPVVAISLPSDVRRLLPTSVGMLALGSSGGPLATADLVVSLWDVSDPTAPSRVGSVETNWYYPYIETDAEPWTIDDTHGLLLMPFSRPPSGVSAMSGAADGPRLGVFRFDDGSLELQSEQAVGHVDASSAGPFDIFRPLTDGSTVFSITPRGLETFPLGEGDVGTAPVSMFVPFWEPQGLDAIDALEAAGYSLRLREREDDGVFYVEAEPLDGGDVRIIELDHRGDALLAFGDAVVVLGLAGEAEGCEYAESLGLDVQEFPDFINGAPLQPDPCATHRARGLTVLSLQDEPHVVDTFTINSEMDVEAIEGITVRTDWPGYVMLDDGRLALFARRTQECGSQADCDKLGVPAYEGHGSPGCNPQTQDCDSLPRDITFFSGNKLTLAVYTLEGIDTDAPELVLGPVLDGGFDLGNEVSLDLSSQLLAVGDTIALTREEPVYDDAGNSISDEHDNTIIRYFLDRVLVRDDGTLEALATVNTPGRPVALDGNLVFSVEPSYSQGAITVALHRSQLRTRGAFIDESTDLAGGVSDSRTIGNHLFVLRQPIDWCAEDLHTTLFAVALASDDLEQGEALELPGPYWSFPYGEPALDDDGDLVVRGGPLPSNGRLFVDISDPMQPRIERYTSSDVN